MAFKVFGLTETAPGTGDFIEHQIDGTFVNKVAVLAHIAALSTWDTIHKDSTESEEIRLRSNKLDRIVIRQVPDIDPDFAKVVLLLDWAGTDGATDITDLSNSVHVDTFSETAQVDTDIQSPERTNTLLLDGTDDYVTFPDSADWDFDTADFTVELSVRFASIAGTQTLIGHSGGGADGGIVLRLAGSNLVWVIGNITIASRAWSPDTDTFFHIAISRTGTDLRMYIEGIQQGATVIDSTDITGSTRVLAIGSLSGLTQELNGSIGAVRITKGVGRYTANFTPPTAMYPTSL